MMTKFATENVRKGKTKAPAKIQITAEQLIRDAKERHRYNVPSHLLQKISPREKFVESRDRKSKYLEDLLRKKRHLDQIS